jgi:hypothetical protein
VVFQTASPFDTPRLMTELAEWTRDQLAALAHLFPEIAATAKSAA